MINYIHNLLSCFFYALFLFFCCGSVPVYGQRPNLKFQHLTTEDGLAQNMVDCMLQDSRGFLWFGTWNGLCQYDGYTFEVFNDEPASPHALGSNFIHSLQEDPYGNIWVGTQQGLYVYLYHQRQFARPQLSTPDATVRSLHLRHDTTMLVGTSRGVSCVRIKGPEGSLESIRHYTLGTGKDDVHGTTVNTVFSDRHHNTWVGTDQGITLITSNGVEHFAHQSGSPGSLSSDQVLSMYETDRGEIWVGTEFGLNRFQPVTRTFESFLHVSSDPTSLAHNSVMDILEDEEGQLLLATLGGLSIRLPDGKGFANYRHEYYTEHSLSNDFVNCLLKDETGNIWIGTERGGINFYPVHLYEFEHIEFDIDDSNSLSHSTVNSVSEDSTFLWIGTAGGGLNRYHKRSQTFHHFRYDANDPVSLSSDFVTSIHHDQQGRIWVGTWGGGLNLMENAAASAIFRHFQRAERPGLVSNFISSIVEDEVGNLWIGTLGGLVRYDRQADQFEEVSEHQESSVTEVGCLLFDEKKNLWIGSRNGLYQLPFQEQLNGRYRVIKYQHRPDRAHTISGNYITSMLQDDEGGLWFGTYGQGLNHLPQREDSVWFETYSTADGLSNNIIYSMEEDREGNLWLGTDYGLSRLNPKMKKVRNFYQTHGLLNNQYYWGASHKNAHGKLYFGGMEGLDAFYPHQIKDKTPIPCLVITDIKLLNESVVPGTLYHGVEVINESPYQVEQVHLSYKEKIFGVEFTSLNYQEPEAIRYAYILEGFDKNWSEASPDRRYASYTNLTPGEYTFKVRATDANGEHAAERVISLHIAPPFWDTLWFRLLGLLALVGGVVGYIRFRTYSLNRQKILLERQVQERTEQISQQKEALSYQAVQLLNNNHELEKKQTLIAGQNNTLAQKNKEILSQRDELIALNKKLKLVSQLKLSFFTNVSHEFRTPLTLIIGPVEKMLKEDNLGPASRHTLDVIHRNAQRLLHLINQIMDFRKIERGRMELKVRRGHLGNFCRNVFQAFEPLSEAKGIAFSYHESELPSEVWYDPQPLENILYNLLSNAFKYTPAAGTVALHVKGLSFDESRLTPTAALLQSNKTVISVKVVDSGVGISEENLPLVFKRFYRIASEETFHIDGSGIGLALTEELIKMHHGEIFVESTPGQGSVFEIQFPCLKDSYHVHEVSEETYDQLTIHQQVKRLRTELQDTKSSKTKDTAYPFDQTRSSVLVVEDNVDLRKFITHHLNKTYNILEAENGEEGQLLAERHNPDLVVSDVMMPGMNGLELCAALKNNLSTSHIPVILLTAKSSVDNQMEGLRTGADDYLPKPFNVDVLEARIQNLIASRKKLRLHFLQSSDSESPLATAPSPDQQFLRRAIKAVEDNLENSSFGAKELVESLGVSRSLLHKKLAALTDQSTTEFINHLRMKKAQHLLRQPSLNISEVAYAVGYSDPKYFSRVFSKHYGQSPQAFLKQITLNK